MKADAAGRIRLADAVRIVGGWPIDVCAVASLLRRAADHDRCEIKDLDANAMYPYEALGLVIEDHGDGTGTAQVRR